MSFNIISFIGGLFKLATDYDAHICDHHCGSMVWDHHSHSTGNRN